LPARSLTYHIGYTFGRQILGAAIQLLTVLVIARALGPEGNGQYAVSILLPTFLSTLLNLGIPAANVYFLGRGDVTMGDALRSNLRYWALLSLLGLSAGTLVVLNLSNELFRDVPAKLLIFCLAAFPPALLQSFFASLLQGLRDFPRFNAAVMVGPVSTLAFVLIALVLLDSGVTGALSAFIAGQLLSLLLTYALLRRSTQLSMKNVTPSPVFSIKAITYGWKAHLSNILAFLNFKADLFLLNFFLGPSATGVYMIAVQLVERLWMISTATSTVILPELATDYKRDSTQNALTPMLSRTVFLLTLAAALALLLTSPLIKLLFGTDYSGAIFPLIVLLPGIVFISSVRILATDIAARGNPALNMYVSAGVLVVNVTANILLIPQLGLVGAALATTIAYIINAVVRLVIFTYYSGDPWWSLIVFGKDDFRRITNLLAPFFKSFKTTH
jgi:O-antigen/teichoic acid export membrane protein